MNDSKKKQAELAKHVKRYAKSNTKSSIIQMFNTFLPFFALWYLSYQSLSISVWLSVALSIVAAGFVIRIFIIFHACTHMSFFKNRKLNRLIGNISGIITHFPYEKWRQDHITHHATSGNLDKRGVGDIWVMTVQEYDKASMWGKLAYRLYRHPVILFGFGAFFLLLFDNRRNRKGAKRKIRWNTY